MQDTLIHVLFSGGLLALIAFLIAAIGLQLLLHSGLARRVAVDKPNHRSLHLSPVPRVGGLVLVPAFLLAWLLLPDRNVDIVLALLAAILTLLSYFDDRSGLPVGLRLGGHLAVGVGFVMLELDFQSVALAIAAVLWIGWCTNLYNFMDGADGLAGGMALFGFSAYGLAAASTGNENLSIACFSVAAASAGFLLFNFPPAKIFMGDAGSIPLGFLAGALGLLGWHNAAWPVWFPLAVFSPFIVDATLTLIKRLLRGERVWQAHREHYYQRLVRMGWSHRRLALAEYALMAAAGASAILLLNSDQNVKCVGLLAWVTLYALAMIAIDLRWKQHLKIEGVS